MSLTAKIRKELQNIIRRLFFSEIITQINTIKDNSITFKRENDEKLTQMETKYCLIDEDLNKLRNELFEGPYMSEQGKMLIASNGGNIVYGYCENTKNLLSTYKAFEDNFRGDEAIIRNLLAPYLELLSPEGLIIDAGCGRGEMLDLISGLKRKAIGIDMDPIMVNWCRGKGHEVECVDIITYLEHNAPSDIGTIFTAQMIEHLNFESLKRLFELSLLRLKEGGVLIAETVNPHSVRALRTFWLDLTHKRPIYPESLIALAAQVGFREAKVVFPGGTNNYIIDRQQHGAYAIWARK